MVAGLHTIPQESYHIFKNTPEGETLKLGIVILTNTKHGALPVQYDDTHRVCCASLVVTTLLVLSG